MASRLLQRNINYNSLRAFEAAARLLSFTRAGEELFVSHSAIIYRVKTLEAMFGTDLFVRNGHSMRLSEAGQKLYPVVKESFDRILESLKEIQGNSNTLTVTVTPSFASRWLVPRLVRFRAAYPEIELRLKPSLALLDFERDGVDLGVRSGRGEWPGLASELLLHVHMTPMCCPAPLDKLGHSCAPNDLKRFALIHCDTGGSRPIGTEWRQWLTANGMSGIDYTHGWSFLDASVALQAAADGLGMAVGYIELAAADISSQRLVCPFPQVVRHEWSYYVVAPELRCTNRNSAAFRDWLHDEAAQCANGA